MYTHFAPAPHAHIEPFSKVSATTWNAPTEDILEYIQRAHPRNLHTLTPRNHTDTPVAGLLALPMHQHFAHCAIPMTGIAGVAVAPHIRGQGAARSLMQNTLRTLRAQNVPLSTLYPTTKALYENVGYTIAGTRLKHTLNLHTLHLDKTSHHDLTRPTTPEDIPLINTLHTSHARTLHGSLQRSEYIWKRLRTNTSTQVHAYTLFNPSDPPKPTGSFTFVKSSSPKGNTLALLDSTTTTPESTRGLLHFLKHHATLFENATWHSPLQNPIHLLTRDLYTTTKLSELWMTRIVHLPKALTAPRYPKHLSATLSFHVKDPLFPENSGPWTLHIKHGQPTLTAGGDPSLNLSIQHLTALYTGFHTPHTLLSLGATCTQHDALPIAHSIFPTLTPSMPEYF